MKHVVLDCDNTAGIPGRDIDDALALIYLKLYSEVALDAVTTSYGNGSQNEVWEATRRLSDQLPMEVPIYRGCDTNDDRSSDASEYLSLVLRAGEADILVTGAASNLSGAVEAINIVGRGTPNRLQRVIMMGGTLEPLIVGGRELQELNVSCDPAGVVTVLEADFEFTFITGNLCTALYADGSRVEMLTSLFEGLGIGWFASDITEWSRHHEGLYGDYGFYPWDLVAAVYLTNPEIFTTVRTKIDLDALRANNGRLKKLENDFVVANSRFADVQIPSKVETGSFWEIVESTLSPGSQDEPNQRID